MPVGCRRGIPRGRLTYVATSPPTQKPTKNQLLSDRLAIYCYAPVYKARTYITEELFYDRKKKQHSGQLIYDDSVKRLWAIRRYDVTVLKSYNNYFCKFS